MDKLIDCSSVCYIPFLEIQCNLLSIHLESDMSASAEEADISPFLFWRVLNGSHAEFEQHEPLLLLLLLLLKTLLFKKLLAGSSVD